MTLLFGSTMFAEVQTIAAKSVTGAILVAPERLWQPFSCSDLSKTCWERQVEVM